jgi:hypothetical protein
MIKILKYKFVLCYLMIEYDWKRDLSVSSSGQMIGIG